MFETNPYVGPSRSMPNISQPNRAANVARETVSAEAAAGWAKLMEHI